METPEKSDGVLVHLQDPESKTIYSLFVSDEDRKRLDNNDDDFASALLRHAIENNSVENDVEPIENNLAEDENVQEKLSTSLDNCKVKNVWGYSETISLIHAVEAHYEELSNAKKRKHMWDNVANELVSNGISASSDSCNQKWRHLLRTYKTYKDNRKATGRGPMKFQFFEAIDAFMGEKPNINSPHAVNVSSFINNENVPADKEDAESSATDRNNEEENNNEIITTSRQLGKKNKYSTRKAEYLQRKMEYKKQKLQLEERKVKALEELVALRKMK